MTEDELVENMKSHAEIGRNPGWDSKVVSLLLDFCHKRQLPNMQGRINKAPTDALIMQIEAWLDNDDRLQQVRNIAG